MKHLGRGGDAFTGWAFAGLISLGFGLSIMAMIAIPIAFVWMLVGYYLGRQQHKYEGEKEKTLEFVGETSN